jgi:predicted metal-dependent hydrolase
MLNWLFPPEAQIPAQKRPLLLRNGRTVDVLWARHARSRQLKLSITERGARLSIPLRVSEHIAEQFLHEHRDWLERQLQESALIKPAQALSVFQTTQVPLFGESVPLRWQAARFARIELQDNEIVFNAPERLSLPRAQNVLKDFYSASVRQAIGAHGARYLPTFPVPPKDFKIRLMTSLWGSLSVNNEVTLDLSLALARPTALEYVFVHELCHLLQRNHSARYWREVERRFPQWQEQRDYLHSEGLRIKAEAQALLRNSSE